MTEVIKSFIGGVWTIGNSSRGVALSTGCNACNIEHGELELGY